ncbi:MAG: YgiQ family radical SAM protein, partial [Desulfamplus sp.]|nr:YgiQ family radical SAM protein [Desulfamplus sp.]
FWGITAGSVDSMISNYTSLKRRRNRDDYTPGGINNRRPDRAVIAYSNLVRRYFKNTAPIVLGGIEASLRRICHYDFWSDSIRRSILFDARADYLVYGMAEKAILALADFLVKKRKKLDNTSSGEEEASSFLVKKPDNTSSGEEEPSSIRGICYISNAVPKDYIVLAPYHEVKGGNPESVDAFAGSFLTFYCNCDPATARGLAQGQDTRYLIQNPPSHYSDINEMDSFADLGFERDVHPYYKKEGIVTALETIRFSISTHRGCYGECNFCSIALHEGRTVRWRSRESIVSEVEEMIKNPYFKGIISDVGGPTANMYGFECKKKLEKGACSHRRCLFPDVCKGLKPDHAPQSFLLETIRRMKGVKKVFVASGIRHDLVAADKKEGVRYLEQVVKHHVSGQMKVAPEHTVDHLLELMGKPSIDSLPEFKKQFDTLSEKAGKKQFLTYYFIAAHPGCTMEDMERAGAFVRSRLAISPRQVQVFTPSPSTISTLMYYTKKCFGTGKKIFVEKDPGRKKRQKEAMTKGPSKKTSINIVTRKNVFGKRSNNSPPQKGIVGKRSDIHQKNEI